ncbi:MAG: hypothetical protein FWE56_03745 [Candidatus Bathyarchaeota archaeon]|nr:hypothetical protein [Candidatus Termiticorpusculum sp.]
MPSSPVIVASPSVTGGGVVVGRDDIFTGVAQSFFPKWGERSRPFNFTRQVAELTSIAVKLRRGKDANGDVMFAVRIGANSLQVANGLSSAKYVSEWFNNLSLSDEWVYYDIPLMAMGDPSVYANINVNLMEHGRFDVVAVGSGVVAGGEYVEVDGVYSNNGVVVARMYGTRVDGGSNAWAGDTSAPVTEIPPYVPEPEPDPEPEPEPEIVNPPNIPLPDPDSNDGSGGDGGGDVLDDIIDDLGDNSGGVIVVDDEADTVIITPPIEGLEPVEVSQGFFRKALLGFGVLLAVIVGYEVTK